MKEELKLYGHHKKYSIYRSEYRWLNCYSDGAIESLQMIPGTYDYKTDICVNEILVQYKSGETYKWATKYISGYNMGQFGICLGQIRENA